MIANSQWEIAAERIRQEIAARNGTPEAKSKVRLDHLERLRKCAEEHAEVVEQYRDKDDMSIRALNAILASSHALELAVRGAVSIGITPEEILEIPHMPESYRYDLTEPLL